jgi:hypothetical protein
MTDTLDEPGPGRRPQGGRPRPRPAGSASRPRRRRSGAPTAALILLVVLVIATWALAGAGGRRSHRPEHPATVPSGAPPRSGSPATAPTTALPPAASTTTTTSPGSLPQTDQFPATDTPQFGSEMNALWSGIVTDSVQAAMPAFFPESAYVQLKSIPDPQSDYAERLVGDYGLDLGAARAQLGAAPSTARLIGVNVPSQYGHWVEPGVCDNSVGYFEVPNSRIVYQQGGEVRSLGIASMISWRGVWYVVHLGAILRPSASGAVDDPEIGPGSSAPSSTC